MTQEGNRKRLETTSSFDGLFEMVKTAVEESLGEHRVGLSLVLGDFDNRVGAFHEIGSNTIVMNRNLLMTVESLSETREKLNSYVFMILLHEYLHSLGHVSERATRELGRRVSEAYFGKDHLAARMATEPITTFFPTLPDYRHSSDRKDYKPVMRFDLSSMSYIR